MPEETYREYFKSADWVGNDFYPVTGWADPKLLPKVGQIIDTLRDTPKIPSQAQWATFLRNHDEIDLSRREVPQLVEIDPGHKVACFNPVPVDEWDRARAAAIA